MPSINDNFADAIEVTIATNGGTRPQGHRRRPDRHHRRHLRHIGAHRPRRRHDAVARHHMRRTGVDCREHGQRPGIRHRVRRRDRLMAATTTFTKDPAAVLDYKHDWAGETNGGPWLAEGETISSSTWTVTSAAEETPALTIDSQTNDTTTATVWLSAGTLNVAYKVTNRITTSAGRTDERTLTINVRNR